MVKWYGGANAVHQPEVESTSCGRNELTSSPTVGTAQRTISATTTRCSTSRRPRRGAPVAGAAPWLRVASGVSGDAVSGHRTDSWARNWRMLKAMIGTIASSRTTATALARPKSPNVNISLTMRLAMTSVS